MRQVRHDPLESSIESALQPGRYIGETEVRLFVAPLESVLASIVPLIEREPTRAATVLEDLVAGCMYKAGQVDDEAGEFGDFVKTVVCRWIRARQSVGADSAATARTVLQWMDRDDMCVLHQLERDAAREFDGPGSSAMETALRATLATSNRRVRPRRIEFLKALFAAQRDSDRLVDLCNAEGGPTPEDCALLAEIFLSDDQYEEALGWVDEGLQLEKREMGSCWRLSGLRRSLMLKLGYRDELITDAWNRYQSHPCETYYDALAALVEESDQPLWRERALCVLDAADLRDQIPLLVKFGEQERLAGFVQRASRESLIGLSHIVSEPAAEALMAGHPGLAARLHIAMALRILHASKSRYYDAALANLETARNVLLQLGRASEWQSLVHEILHDHRRKSSFMLGFERLLNGGPAAPLSFLEKAREQWKVVS